MKIVAIIPAGGSGFRTGTSTPKQFLKFHGKELIAYTIEVFQYSPLVDEIIVAVNHSYIDFINKLKLKYKLKKISMVVEGGNERQDSVYNALSVLHLRKNDLVAVHDAARPLLSKEVLNNAIETAKKKGNAVVSIKARDTLLETNDNLYKYPDRSNIYYIQTPQIFKYSELKSAFELAYKNNFYGTDESMLMQKAGYKLNLVEGSLINLKVTTADDLLILKKLLKKSSV
ncbi:MAG TPA: 2-C-methyl-D-erythritol 4-phosphate cytidylyltransferase [Ignavibacteriaceae bacterium]|nr:2-C-methyl-D-erythritol 4-phosphate cytidylyltransferase [Ignavibacteriaceae bacterium]